MALNFVCPDCGNTQLEEVIINVTVTNYITLDAFGGYHEVSDTMYEDGNIEQYSCNSCNFKLRDFAGHLISNPEEAAEWLLDNCKQG